jgi:hypothetical protein
MADARYNKASSDPARAWVDYASVSLSIESAITDLNVQANSTLFSRIKLGREILIKTDKQIAVKLNLATNDAIDLLDGEALPIAGIPISNIFITTTAAGAFVRIIILGWN